MKSFSPTNLKEYLMDSKSETRDGYCPLQIYLCLKEGNKENFGDIGKNCRPNNYWIIESR